MTTEVAPDPEQTPWTVGKLLDAIHGLSHDDPMFVAAPDVTGADLAVTDAWQTQMIPWDDGDPDGVSTVRGLEIHVEDIDAMSRKPKPADLETKNDFMIAYAREAGRPIVYPYLGVRITDKQQAYRTAAWLKHMADSLPDDGTEATFEDIETAIANT